MIWLIVWRLRRAIRRETARADRFFKKAEISTDRIIALKARLKKILDGIGRDDPN